MAAARSTFPLVDNMLPSCPHILHNIHYNSHNPPGAAASLVVDGGTTSFSTCFINWEDWVVTGGSEVMPAVCLLEVIQLCGCF